MEVRCWTLVHATQDNKSWSSLSCFLHWVSNYLQKVNGACHLVLDKDEGTQTDISFCTPGRIWVTVQLTVDLNMTVLVLKGVKKG